MKRMMMMVVMALGVVLSAQADRKILIITGGQSNTDGRLDADVMPEYLQAPNELCMVSYHSPYDGERMGKFYAFYPTSGTVGQPKRWAYDDVVYYHLSKALKRTYYVAKTTYGGTSVSPEVVCSPSNHAVADAAWAPGYGSGYHWSADADFLAATDIAGVPFTRGNSVYEGQSLLKAWIANIDAAIDALQADGSKVDIRCIIWHQGESDRKADGKYYENLKAVVAYVRQHLVEKTGKRKYARLPFFCGNIPDSSHQKSKGVNEALRRLAEEDKNFHMVDISDLTMKSDNVHFDAPSAVKFGERMYEAIMK